MESFLLFVVLVVLIVRWGILSRRYAGMEERIEMLVRSKIEPNEITRLIKRITQLEDTIADLKRGRVVVEAEPAQSPRPESAPMEAEPRPGQAPVKPANQSHPAPKPAVAPAIAPVVPPVMAPEPLQPESEPLAPPPHAPVLPPPIAPLRPPPPAPRPVPLIPEPARPSRTGAEWEALVGGNWFNKLGILIIVVGIALLLGYAFPRMGPASISAVALTLSFTMLVSGVIVERREHYVVFARGLIAGGWAGLYFTTYAMQALDAAKVIHNPVLGAILLLAVATGMVMHSLRYREQTITGLAYFMAFVTLAITQVTALSVIALVPLAGSLLVIAYRFEWPGMALFALAATYATCASKPDNGSPLWSAQTVFATYWLLFEAYDLLRARRRSNHPSEQAILPFNALGFVTISYAKWSKAAPDDLYLLAIGVAVAYLASTILRAVLRPPASFPAEIGTLERIFSGGFEGPITLAAAGSAAAAILKLHGQTVNNVLLAEGEALFLSGLFFRQDYPRRLAATLFAALGVKFFVTDIPNAGSVTVMGRTLHDWTPSAVLAALLFYVDRALRKLDVSYGYAASALLALIICYDVPLRYMGIGCLGFGAVLFFVGWRLRLPDFRIQGYLGGTVALVGIAIYQQRILDGSASPLLPAWISLALAAAAAFGAALVALRSAADRLTDGEREKLEFAASAIASAASAAFLWKVVPDSYLGPAWMALAIVVLELGLRRWPPEFRWHAQLLAALGVGRVLFFIVLPLHSIAETGERIAIGCAALVAYLFAARMFVASPDEVDPVESRHVVDAASACGSLFVLLEMWALLDPVLVAPVWALFALLLIGTGFRLKLPALRMQGHAVAVCAVGRLFAANFDAAYRLPTVAVVIAAHYYESWRYRRMRARLAQWESLLDRPYLYTAAGLIACLLYRELHPQFVEIGWAFATLTLLIAGRMLDLGDLRYQSYGLAILTFGRALAMEFSTRQVFASTEERIVAGAVVVACLFVAQLLIPKERQERLLYSLLATALATTVLFQEVSGSMLTVAWGIEGAVLLGVGFPLRDRTLRLSGLVLFLVCVGKLFLYDLRALETLYRILSFLVLGLILVGVSWVYTRFREQVQRYL